MIKGIIIGLFIGVLIGMATMSLCAVSGRETRREEREKKNDESGIY